MEPLLPSSAKAPASASAGSCSPAGWALPYFAFHLPPPPPQKRKNVLHNVMFANDLASIIKLFWVSDLNFSIMFFLVSFSYFHLPVSLPLYYIHSLSLSPLFPFLSLSLLSVSCCCFFILFLPLFPFCLPSSPYLCFFSVSLILSRGPRLLVYTYS